jgi:hypothetical protein
LSEQPLLNHLLAVTRAATPASLTAETSINGVYRNMLDHVWRRSWGDEGQLPALDSLTRDNFQKLFESIGLAVWQHGSGRSTTLEIVADIARREKLSGQLDILAKGAESGALDLLTAFYFRREGASDSFELTHKSFGEYFAALRLFRLVESLHRAAHDPDFEEEDGLRRWYRWTHAARITLEILAFLEGELRELSVEAIRARRETLIRLFNRNLRTGMAHLTIDGVTSAANSREAQQRDAAAELALFTVLGACSAVLIEKTEDLDRDQRRRIVAWSAAWLDRGSSERTSTWDLLRRLEAGTAFDPIAGRYMLGMDLTQQVVRTDLADARCVFASANAAYLSGADLSHADLGHADLSDADLSGADLSHADLSGAELIRGANLRDANLCGVRNLTPKQFAEARSTDGATLTDDPPEK